MCRKSYFWHWLISHFVTKFILSLQLMDLFGWKDSSVACVGDPYSLEVRVILGCELPYSPSFIWGWLGWHFTKLQNADCKLPAFFLPTPKLPKLWPCSFNKKQRSHSKLGSKPHHTKPKGECNMAWNPNEWGMSIMHQRRKHLVILLRHGSMIFCYFAIVRCIKITFKHL